jgi:hypothetical protein
MAKQRAQAGSPLRISAGDYNDAVDAGQWFAQQQALGRGGSPLSVPVNPCVVRVRNDSGGDLTSGSVVELGAATVTLQRQYLWFSAAARSGNDPFCGVLLESIPDGKYGDCQISGVCMADIDVVDTDNTHARVVPGSTQLKGDFGGWCRIVYKPSGTGVKSCVVLLGFTEQTVRKATASGTITAGGTGTANVYVNGSSRGSVTVYLDWMDSGGNIGSNTEMFIQYFHDQDRWQVIGAECST